ncbi:MAG: DUF6430 domain-containing protein [Clostridiaceae bacterium]|nr:DUF6430 domain-containing protein [Clostridiaceae bacterium]
MMCYIKYACLQYFTWLGYIAIIIGLVAVIPVDEEYNYIALIVVIICFALAFVIPFLIAVKRCKFKIKTVGKSNVSFEFGNLLEERCFVITTNRYFDVNPTGEWIAPNSLLGIYANKYFPNDIERLEALIDAEVGDRSVLYEYGKTIKIQHDGKIVYLLAFTDRKKTKQPKDFYEKSLQGVFEFIVNENHGETIAIPLIGDNNDLSDSGFDNSIITFKCLMTMINSFETRHPRSGIKLKIVALPEKRAELINAVHSYTQ